MILCFILKIILYPTLKSWRIADWQCYDNFFCRAKWLSYAYIDLLFYFLFHYCLPLDIEYSSLCYTVTQEIFNSQFCFFKKPNSSRLTIYKSSSVHNHNSLKFNYRRAVKRWGMLMKVNFSVVLYLAFEGHCCLNWKLLFCEGSEEPHKTLGFKEIVWPFFTQWDVKHLRHQRQAFC